MSEYIPDELLTEILARLPVVSLLRFKSVCKSWCSLIASPSFITNHLNHSRTNPEKLLVRRFNYDEIKPRYFSVCDDEKFGNGFSELEERSCCKSGAGYMYRIVGSCNGLLCLCKYFFCDGPNPSIVVWNPSIRESIVFPLPSTAKYPHLCVFGFGAHPTTHEYKVIRVIYEMETYLGFPKQVELYTQSTGSWRCISKEGPPYCISRVSSNIFVNGAVHWVARKPGVMDAADGFCNLIVSFDMASESFSEIMLPPALAHEESILPPALAHDEPVLLKSFGGPLAVLDQRTCCIWVMKEYGVVESWTKLFSIDLPRASLRRTLVLRKNGEVLLLKEENLVSYDPRSKTTNNTGIKARFCSFTIINYMESLLSVKGGNGVF